MFSLEKFSKLAIWGVSYSARTLYCKYKDRYDIQFFVDEKLSDDDSYTVYDKSVVSPSRFKKLFNTEIKILTVYQSSLDSLIKQGYELMDDIVPLWLLEYKSINMIDIWKYTKKEKFDAVIKKLMQSKKGCVLYGNCQMRLIKNYLMANQQFNDEYMILDIPLIFNFGLTKNFKSFLNESALWLNTSLFLYHEIKANNRFAYELSSEYLLAKLTPIARSMQICNLWFSSYFPQTEKNLQNIMTEAQMSGLFAYGDKNVRDLLSKNYSADEIVRIVCAPDFYTKEQLDKFIDKDFDNISIREASCDITILDFIKIHYNKRLLFHSCNHPTHFLMKEVATRILQKIGVEKAVFDNEWSIKKDWTLKGQDLPIYPSVAQLLGLSIKDHSYYCNRAILPQELSFKEWLRLYIASLHYSPTPSRHFLARLTPPTKKTKYM